MTLLARIQDRSTTVAVVGLGYVGLPLAMACAEAGYKVVGIDLSEDKVASLNRSQSYIQDVPDEQLAPLFSISSEGSFLNSSIRSINIKRLFAISACKFCRHGSD